MICFYFPVLSINWWIECKEMKEEERTYAYTGTGGERREWPLFYLSGVGLKHPLYS